MKTQFEVFPKGPQHREVMSSVLGDGIFAVDGVKWLHQRKTASNLFTARRFRESMTHIIREHISTLLRILERAQHNDETLDLFRLLNKFTSEAFAETGFGVKFNSLDSDQDHPFHAAFDSAQRTLVLQFMIPPWVWQTLRILGIGGSAKFAADMKVIDDTVLGIISQYLEEREKNERKRDAHDLVSLFIDRFDSSPESRDSELNPRYLRDIVVTFMIAGRDTTAQALAWFVLSVSRHPNVARKIREALQQELPDLCDGKIETPTMEQVQQLTYLEAALNETLRLYPSVPNVSKNADRDVVLCDGTFVPKGSRVNIATYAMGRMTYVWGPDATEFKPERWIDPVTNKLQNISAFKFFAFNAGPHTCLGKNLAMLEMKIVAASLLSRFDLTVLNEQDVTYDFSITLPIRGEMRVAVREKSKFA